MVALTEEQAAAWGTWIAATWPLLQDNEENAKLIAEYVYGIGKGVWDERNVRLAVYVNRNVLTWTQDRPMEHPDAIFAKRQAEAAKKVADAEAVKVAAEAARVKAERKQQMADEEWKNTHRDLLGKSSRNAYDEHAQAEQQRIADAKATFQAAKEITNAMLQKEIQTIAQSYIAVNPVTQKISHQKTEEGRKNLASIRVYNGKEVDWARTLGMVRQAIKKLD
jgi:hypothetical protein